MAKTLKPWPPEIEKDSRAERTPLKIDGGLEY